MQDIALGHIVLSKVGRDAGRIFVITGVLDENHVSVSDGDLRRIEKPKKKKLKHIKPMGTVIEPIKDKLLKGQKVSNAEIRKALEAYEAK